MVFNNRIDQLNFPKQQQTALDILRDFMFLTGITVIEHDDLFIADAFFADKHDLALFLYKKEDKKIVSYKDYDCYIKMQVPKGLFYLFNLIDIFDITFII